MVEADEYLTVLLAGSKSTEKREIHFLSSEVQGLTVFLMFCDDFTAPTYLTQTLKLKQRKIK
jgi:hypothetical protein